MSIPQKGIALVIGVADYESQTKLPSCINDANGMEKALSLLNFEVIVCHDPNRAELINKISYYLEVADKYSTCLFYYSGHGVQIDGKNYLCPVDCEYIDNKALFIEKSLVGLKAITDYCSNNTDKTNIIILDACRTSLSFAKSFIGEGLAPITAGSGCFIGFATAPNTVAHCDSDGYGYYTESLLHHISTPNVKIEDMFKAVREEVIDKSEGVQTPWESTSLKGDFFFNTLDSDKTDELIYRLLRDSYSAQMLMFISVFFNKTISDCMRIYNNQKSEKPGGIPLKGKSLELLVLGEVLGLGFTYSNYRWAYNGIPVRMGEFYHDIASEVKPIRV